MARNGPTHNCVEEAANDTDVVDTGLFHKNFRSLAGRRCNKCKAEWYYCREDGCEGRPTNTYLPGKAANNHVAYHVRKRKAAGNEVNEKKCPRPGNNDASDLCEAGDDSDGMEPELLDIPVDFTGFGRLGTQQFFANLHAGEAINRLVKNACFGEDNNDTFLIDPLEKKLHLLLTNLCYGVTRTEREKLAEVLRLTVICSGQQARERHESENSIVTQHDSGRPPVYVRTRLCTKVQHMRNMYIRDQNAIITNLPRPTVLSCDEHSYVSLTESVRCALASVPYENISWKENGDRAFPALPPIRTVDNRNVDSPRWSDIIKRTDLLEPHDPSVRTLTLWINEWSDDFEPNQTKTNRGSVWMKTATFGWRTKCSGRTVVKTVPIALGHKSKNHEVIERLFKQELQSLRLGKDLFYYGGDRKMVRVYAELFASLQDQPERRGGAHLLAGNSVYHARWGYSADCYALRELLPACQCCFSALTKYTYASVEGCALQQTECQDCLRWSLDCESKLLNTEAPKIYPEGELVDGGFIRPFKLTFELLRGAMQKACLAVENGSWTKPEAANFLRVHCINDNLIEDFLSIAGLRHAKARAVSKPESEQSVLEKAFIQLYADEPQIFDLPLFPSVWDRGTSLRQHIDVIMHLLFLGIQKGTMKSIRKWTKGMGKSPAFIAYTEVLSRFPSGVSWCEIEPYTGDELGGWESMNFLGIARVAKWFYGPMESVMSGVEYVDPETPVESWKKDMCVKWVQVRGLDLDDVDEPRFRCGVDLKARCKQLMKEKKSLEKAPVAFLRDIISVFLKRAGGPPEMMKDSICGVNLILQLSRALQAMLARIMSPTVTELSIQEVDRHIKIFLSIFDKVDKSLRRIIQKKATTKKKWKPKWITSYNYVCLLNLPGYIEELGCLRSLWEGDDQGEAFIGEVKPKLMQGLRPGWQLATMEKLVIEQALGTVIEKLDDEHESTDGEPVVDAAAISDRQISPNDYHTYKDLLTLQSAWSRGDPISCVKMASLCPTSTIGMGVFGVILGDDNGHRFTVLSRNDFKECQNGCQYHSWSAGDEVVPWGDLIPVSAYMLLPHHDRQKKSVYTAYDSEWREISKCGNTFDLPTYSDE